jgi:chemotaxis protein CheX
MALAEGELRDIADGIWSTLFGLALGPAVEGASGAADTLCGWVDVTGPAPLRVVVELDAALVRRLSAALFGIAEADCAEADLCDTVGEIANMAGGGVRALVPGSVGLSLPSVERGGSQAREGVVAATDLDCEGASLRVRVAGVPA